jgi:hypothetical protein
VHAVAWAGALGCGEPIIRGIELCLGVFHRGQGTGERILGRRLDGLTCRRCYIPVPAVHSVAFRWASRRTVSLAALMS